MKSRGGDLGNSCWLILSDKDPSYINNDEVGCKRTFHEKTGMHPYKILSQVVQLPSNPNTAVQWGQ